MKKCRECKKEKKKSEFYSHKAMGDGTLSFCKDCVRARVNKHASENREKIRAYDKRRWAINWKDPVFRKKKIRATEDWRRRNKLKRSAHQKVAVYLTRPDGCELCGQNGRVIGHHEDYSKPLQVMWVCSPCHYKVHHK